MNHADDSRPSPGRPNRRALLRAALALGASGLPYLAVTDGSGSVVWTHGGVASVETLDRQVASVL